LKYRLCFLLIVLCIVIGANTPSEGATISKTEWIIDTEEFVQGDTVEMYGNVEVRAGGILRLNSVTIIFKCSVDSEFGLSVETGGELYIDGSIITADNLDKMFLISFNGSYVEMKNSTLNGSHGLQVRSGNTLIENNTITKNREGIQIEASGVKVIKNHIEDNSANGIVMYYVSDCQLIDNYISYSGDSGFPLTMVNSHNNDIIRNEIIQGHHPGGLVMANSNGNLIEGNQISGLGIGVNMMYSCDNNIIKGNTISTNEAAMMIWGWDNHVENNTIYETGIYLIHAYNTFLTKNFLSNIKDNYGFLVRRSSNNKIYSNIMEAGAGTIDISSGLLLFDSSKKNLIQGNKISDFERGVSLFYNCDENSIAGNELVSANVFGLLFENSNHNVIYSDNVFKDVDDKYYDSGTNSYNNPGPVPDVTKETPPQFDSVWNAVISDGQVIENQTITIGNLRVKDGGSLTLNNTTIIAGGRWDTIQPSDLPSFEAGITVQNGGKLYINDCLIRHAEYGYGFQIDIHKDAVFEMKNSQLNGCGNEWWYGGIRIEADNTILKNNIIEDVNRHSKLTHHRRPKMTHLWVTGLIPVGPRGGPPG
jgi:parallel beta-helix repeat protein